MRHQYKHLLKRYSFYLGGDQPHVPWVERIRSVIGAFIGLMLVLTTAKFLGELSGLDEWLMASLGASALLVFALPGSPMAQPWAVIAGNTLSALVGIAMIHFVSEPLLAMPLADTLKMADANSAIAGNPIRSLRTISREHLWQAQTPQMFGLRQLHDAIEGGIRLEADITDEASAMELAGACPLLVEGATRNFKVTHPADWELMQTILQASVK